MTKEALICQAAATVKDAPPIAETDPEQASACWYAGVWESSVPPAMAKWTPTSQGPVWEWWRLYTQVVTRNLVSKEGLKAPSSEACSAWCPHPQPQNSDSGFKLISLASRKAGKECTVFGLWAWVGPVSLQLSLQLSYQNVIYSDIYIYIYTHTK